jgi:hypothetical protein
VRTLLPQPEMQNADRPWPASRAIKATVHPREGRVVSGTYPVVAEANQRGAMSEALLPQPGGFEGLVQVVVDNELYQRAIAKGPEPTGTHRTWQFDAVAA